MAAIYAGQQGLRTALVERGRLGGTCLNAGCIPTKALVEAARRRLELEEAPAFGLRTGGVELDWSVLMEHKEKVVAQLVGGVGQLLAGAGVAVYQGTAQLRSPGEVEVDCADGRTERLVARNLIIATGARAQLPPVAGLDLPGVITSEQAISLPTPPS
ncbi:MAG: FAD-dependent oxidoreductase, partial [Actinobacteria bacterium]|nr:FAD-dependent oxidoreductase [Actinomycetota bacterium]